MQKVEINIYEFNELSEKVKQKVLNQFRENNDLNFLEEDLTEYTKELLKENNINIIKDFNIQYSLSCCQGDGLQFIGLFKYKNLLINIKHSGFYYHNKAVSIDITKEDADGNETEAIIKEKDEFKSLYYEITNKAEKLGYDIIEAEHDEKNIIETIEINEYKFYADGRIY